MHRNTRSSWQSLLSMPLALLSLLLVLALASTQASAQATQGSIIGSVKDAGGAVVPGAVITLTNMDEGTVRTAKSNAWAIIIFRT